MDRLSGVTLLEEATTRLQKNVLAAAILILKSISVVQTGKQLPGLACPDPPPRPRPTAPAVFLTLPLTASNCDKQECGLKS